MHIIVSGLFSAGKIYMHIMHQCIIVYIIYKYVIVVEAENHDDDSD